MSDLQKTVQQAIDARVESGAEVGLQVAVYRHGELIVDAVAGPGVDSGTLFYTWSMGKAMTATVIHRLVEQGVFGYDTRISSVWPEFGVRAATVRHALQHTLGLPGIGVETTVEDVCDWELICARVAASEPWWEPGTLTGYHAYTFGFILGELARRATGKRISELLRTQIALPLGVDGELYFGMPAAARPRLARMIDAPGPEMPPLPPDSPIARASSPALWPTAELGNRPDVLAADIPAGGKMTARAIARMYASLLGEVDGVRLVRPATLETIVEDRFEGIDQVFGNPATWGLGFSLSIPGRSEVGRSFGMGGSGGTFGYADVASGVAFALTKNLQTPDFSTSEQILNLVTEGI